MEVYIENMEKFKILLRLFGNRRYWGYSVIENVYEKSVFVEMLRVLF